MERTIRPLLISMVTILIGATSLFAQNSVGFGHGARPGLSVSSNVNGAEVYVNNDFKGTTPLISLRLDPGTYVVTVRAQGYASFQRQVTVNGPTSINAYLQPLNYSLTVTSNVNGADVYLNGRHMGRTPMTATLQPGTYHLRVEAGGYRTYSTQVTVNGGTTINAYLQGQLARIHIRIPHQYLNDNGRGDWRRAQSEVRVFVDNRREQRDDFELPQGNHTIRFESGSFVVQQSFYFNGGRDYTISPVLSIQVN